MIYLKIQPTPTGNKSSMSQNLLQKSLNLLLKRQTSILSAAFIIMGTTVLSLMLGLFKKRLLVTLFGASNVVGVYDAATRFPDALFQLTIAATLSTAFIPVFSNYLTNNKEEEAHKMASNLLSVGLIIFTIISIILALFAPFFLKILNPGAGFSASDMDLMASLMRIIIIGQLLFIIGAFFSALLQSYNHFFIAGFAAAMYNLGIIVGLLLFSKISGIYSGAYGIIIGALFYIIVQLWFIKKIGFSFKPNLSFRTPAVLTVGKLMWPRTLSLAISQLGSILTISLISYLPNTGRSYFIFDLAQTLAFAPVGLIGGSIAQAALPILSREKDNIANFKSIFITSFNQMLYLILPVAALMLVLRIPIVRLVYGADKFDWSATVLTGRILSYFSIFIICSALIQLVNRAFYALQNTFIPLVVGGLSTIMMLLLSGIFILIYQSGFHMISYPYSIFNNMFHGEIIFSFGVEGLAFANSLGMLITLIVLLIILHRKTGGFNVNDFYRPISKIIITSMLMTAALYIPLKILDQLVFDTSHTIGLIILTGITSAIGLSIYLFLTWIFNVKEAQTYLLIFKRVGNWREILGISEEVIDANRGNP
jgi:putative peptidoglycan lipid II flippase